MLTPLAESGRPMVGWCLHRAVSTIRVRVPAPLPIWKAAGYLPAAQGSECFAA